MILGAHRSTAGGAWRAAESGKAIGCDAIQIFTRAPMRWAGSPISDEDARRFRETCQGLGLKTVAHDIYLTNLASPKEEIRNRSIASFKDELERCRLLGIPYLVTHCGSHEGSGEEVGIRKVGEAIRECLSEAGDGKVCVLLEGTAGQGDALGWRFEHLLQMLERTDRKALTGICLDTCHLFAAGYDISSAEGYQETFQTFDRLIGLAELKVIHANDARKGLGSRVDRHEHIGEGRLGDDTFRRLLRDQRFQNIPIIIETPGDDRHEEDLRHLRALEAS